MAQHTRVRRKRRRRAPQVRRQPAQSGSVRHHEAAQHAGSAGGMMIGGVLDPAEKAADLTAERIMRMSTPVPVLHRKCAACEATEQVGAVHRKCAECEAEDKARRSVADGIVRAKEGTAPVASGVSAAPASASASKAISGLGTGRTLPASERAFFEPRFGADFSSVRIHDDHAANKASRSISARAFTLGNDVAFAQGEYAPGTDMGRRLMAHELAHVVRGDAGGRREVRRALKFELQVKRNKIHAWDGGATTWTLPRKFGPADFLVKDPTGLRLESETGGQLEFETDWERKWPKLEAQVKVAQEMVNKMNAPAEVTIGAEKFKPFPFDISHLQVGNWKVPKGKKFEDNTEPGHPDKALDTSQKLMVKEGDTSWTAYIQTSESLGLDQFDSFLSTYESAWHDPSTPASPGQKKVKSTPDFASRMIADRDSILAAVNTGKIASSKLANLNGFLLMVVAYIYRGQLPAASPVGHATKFTFSTMSRTHFGSIFMTKLDKDEKKLFRKFVADADKLLLTGLGVTKKSKFFVHGQGSTGKGSNPTIGEWLKSIVAGKDRLSSREGGRLSAAMGKFKINEEKGKNEGLIRYEVRMTPGNSQPAADWLKYAKARFKNAFDSRNRKGSKTELEM